MPFYSYRCVECESTFRVFHGMSESQEVCEVCGQIDPSALIRVYDKVSIPVTNSSSNPGQRVKEFIEQSREMLDEQKKEARNNHD